MSRLWSRMNRKTRLLLELAALLLVVLFWLILLDFPHLTRTGAYRSLERENLSGPGAVLYTLDGEEWNLRGPVYIARQEGGLSWGEVRRDGLFWRGGQFEGVALSADGPLTLLSIHSLRAANPWFLAAVYTADPAVDAVEVDLPMARGHTNAHTLVTARASRVADRLFLFEVKAGDYLTYGEERDYHLDGEDARLRAYDASGVLIYEQPAPESWARDYDFSS